VDDSSQHKHQNVGAAPGSTQTQYDPTYCCGISQIGGTNNEERIRQNVDQNASEPNAFEFSELIGQSITPSGTCDVNQHGRNDVDSASNSFSATPCPFVVLVTACTSVFEVEGPPAGCTEEPPITTPPNECGIECIRGPSGQMFMRRS
jgi:hypothetical protein